MMEQFYTVRQVVEFAISLEQASQQFYRRLAAGAVEPAIKGYLLQLAEEESLHEAALRGVLDALADEGVSGAISPQEIDAYIQAVKLPEPLDYLSAVRLARDKENASRMLYSVLAGATDDPVIEKTFLYLEQQEIGHLLYFEKEYARLSIGRN
jgi:rubrerythrin